MKISPVVAHLRQYCPIFAGRVSGGIDLEKIAASQQMAKPAAFVVATGDDAGENDLQNGVRQDITDTFDVLVVMAATEERGQGNVDQVHDVRAQLWRALIGWKPEAYLEPITYDGGELFKIDRAQVLYRFAFASAFQLGRSLGSDPAETWHEYELDGLPRLEGVDINMDCIDPADRNRANPGPDGRIEAKLNEDLP